VSAVTVLLVAPQWTPTIPAAAASTPVAHATLGDGESSDAQQCLDRVTRSAGWMDLCWAIVRAVDLDPTKDYYTLHVYGTVSGAAGGLRWSRIRADLVGAPADGVFDAWPDGTFDGPCRSIEVALPVDPTAPRQEIVCGRTIGSNLPAAWAHSVDWTCVGCIVPDPASRALALYESVAVPQGTKPSWSIGADFGD